MSGEFDAPDPLNDDAYRDLFREQESSPAPSETGRLFRTYRAESVTEAIVAIKPDRARRLRTMQFDAEAAPVRIDLTAAEDPIVEAAPVKVLPERKKAPGLRPGAVYVIDFALTLLVAFAEVFIRGGLGWITGLALLVASIYTATVVRLSDWVVVVIAPPIAFFLAVITAGQLNQADPSFINRIAQTFVTLGTNWPWIIGSIVLAFVTTVVRRRLSP